MLLADVKKKITALSASYSGEVGEEIAVLVGNVGTRIKEKQFHYTHHGCSAGGIGSLAPTHS
jgi:hypothetical protein